MTTRNFLELENDVHVGNFWTAQKELTPGQLTFRGPDTSLLLWADQDINLLNDQSVAGFSPSLNKVTLLRFHQPGQITRQRKGNEVAMSLTLFPEYVVTGDFHVDPAACSMTSITFSIDESRFLFPRYSAFGSVAYNQKVKGIVEEILRSQDREVLVGENPFLHYFTGEGNIFEAATSLGHISCYHAPSLSIQISDIDKFSNEILFRIQFHTPVALWDAVRGATLVLRFIELIIGRPQNVLNMQLEDKECDEIPAIVQVYGSLNPKYQRTAHSSGRPFPFMTSSELPAVLTNWLARQDSWQDARSMFYFGGFVNQKQYNAGRLVTAVNVFDILPPGSVPVSKTPPEKVAIVAEAAKLRLKKLPESRERGQLLDAIGRLGRATVREKIRYRAEIIAGRNEAFGDELYKIGDAAVDCRNYFVHGSKSKKEYWKSGDLIVFFTKALEFIFAASDLVEAGWDINAWICSGMVLGAHPWDTFLLNYQDDLKRFLNFDNESVSTVRNDSRVSAFPIGPENRGQNTSNSQQTLRLVGTGENSDISLRIGSYTESIQEPLD